MKAADELINYKGSIIIISIRYGIIWIWGDEGKGNTEDSDLSSLQILLFVEIRNNERKLIYNK